MAVLLVVLAWRVFLPLGGDGSLASAAPAATVASASPSPSWTATWTSSPTATASPTPTASPIPSATFAVVVVAPAAPVSAVVVAPVATATFPSTTTPTASATATASPTESPTQTATATPSATATATITRTPTPTPTVLLVVLAGQSNMGGWAPAVYPSAPEDAALVVAGGTWTAPVIDASGTHVTNGPGLGIGRALVRSGIARVGIVNCARPGTIIHQWQPGDPVYDACAPLVRATGLAPAAVFFYQGETDAVVRPPPEITRGDPTHWAEMFAQTVASWRRDFGDPDLPVVFARIAHNTDPLRALNTAVVQAQQDAIAIPGVVEVDPEPVTLQDSVHLDDASWYAVGEKMAAAYSALGH